MCSSRKFEKTPALFTSTSSRPNRGDGGADQTLDVRPRPRRLPRPRHRPTGGREPFARRLEPVLPPVGEHHRRSSLGQPARAGEAEALRGAGDERHLAAQVEQRAAARRLGPSMTRYVMNGHGDAADRLRHRVGRGGRRARALHRPGGAAVPLRARPGHDAPRRRAAPRLHEELEAPCTFFVCGRTLLHALDAIEPLAASPLFDIQQHTYSQSSSATCATARRAPRPRRCSGDAARSRCARSSRSPRS